MPGPGTICRFGWPIVVAAGANEVWLYVSGVAEAVQVAPGEYYMLGDGTAADFLVALAAAFEAHSAAPFWTIALGSSVSKITFTCDQPFRLYWTNPATTLDPLLTGCAYDLQKIASPFVAYAPYQAGHLWHPGVRYVDDMGGRSRQLRSSSESMVGGTDTYRYGKTVTRSIRVDMIPQAKVLAEDASDPNAPFDLFFDYLATGGPFRWVPDVTVPGTHAPYAIVDDGFFDAYPVGRMNQMPHLGQVSLPMRAL